MAFRSQPPADDGGRPPRRRLAPPIAKPRRRILAFEPRLALSANPGADLLLDALAALHSDDFCTPAVSPAIPSSPEGPGGPLSLEPQTSSSEDVSGGISDEVPPLLAQAAIARSTYGLSGAGQTVAVIDSGIAWDHVALGQGFGPGYRVVGGWDFAESDANPYDDAPAGFHGTHVAGLIGGQSDSLRGIAPGADLVALRVFDDSGAGSLDWIESALRWVHDNRNAFESPITTVNVSIGALLPEGLAADVQAQLADELQQLHDDAILVVAAAGNAFDAAFSDRLSYPASSPHTWAVGSVDADGSLSEFSQRSDAILATVGRGVSSAVPDHVLGWDGEVNDYHAASGTSMAAPQIAAASVLLREAIDRTGDSGDSATLDELLQRLRQTADLRVDEASGLSYYDVNLIAAIESVLNPVDPASPDPPYVDAQDADLPYVAPPYVDLGPVEWSRVELTPGSAVQATAVRDGWFSVAFEAETDRPLVRIADAGGNVLWNAVAPPSGQIDIPVVADQTLSISTSTSTSGSEASAVRLANVIGLHDGRLQLTTGAEDPEISLDLSEGVVAQVANLRYSFAAGEITSGVIDGGSGADHLQITSSTAAARLILNPYADGTLSEGELSLALRGFEDVGFDGGGGADRVYLYDTRGNDTLEARPGAATLEGVGFRYQASAVQRVYVHATAGGTDMAFLHDSPADDRLAVRPQFVSLRGGEFFNSAYGFERVYAYATAGGSDSADLYDSAGDDRMTASAESAWISGQSYYVQARSFDSVTGHATSGGDDLATLYSESDAAGRWHQNVGLTELRTDEGASRGARGFERVESYVAGIPLQLLGGLAVDADPPEAEGEDWRASALLEATKPQSAEKLSLDSMMPPPIGNEEVERRLLETLFADLGADDEI